MRKIVDKQILGGSRTIKGKLGGKIETSSTWPWGVNSKYFDTLSMDYIYCWLYSGPSQNENEYKMVTVVSQYFTMEWNLWNTRVCQFAKSHKSRALLWYKPFEFYLVLFLLGRGHFINIENCKWLKVQIRLCFVPRHFT